MASIRRVLGTTKRRVVFVVGVVVFAGIGVAAWAYFTASGSGSSEATVGTASNWTVTTEAPTGGALLPGAGSNTVAYTVTNVSDGSQQLTSVAGSVTANNSGAVYDTTTNAFVDGCLASWFTVTDHPPTLPVTLASGASATGSETIAMTDSGTNQDACQGVTPQVVVSAS